MILNFLKKSSELSIVGILAITGVSAFLLWGTMNTTGFCWQKGRYLSDDEFFRNVVESHYLDYGFLRTSNVADRVGVARDQVKELVPYKSVDGFFTINPNCCEYFDPAKDYKMGHGGVRDPSLYYRFFGIAWETIAVRYKVFYLDVTGNKKHVAFSSAGWSTACGQYVLAPLKYIVG